jgi:transposase
LAEQAFAHRAHRIVLQEARNAARHAAMAPVVDALQAMRGVGFVGAVILAAEVGNLRRFDNPR